MKLQTKLILLMGGSALFIMLGVLGVAMVHLRHTTDEVKNLGRRYTLEFLQKRASHTIGIFRNAAESDFLRFARSPLPRNESAAFNPVANAFFVVRDDGTGFSAVKNPDGTVGKLDPDTVSSVRRAWLARPVGTPETSYLLMDGALWIGSEREQGTAHVLYCIRIDRKAFEDTVRKNTGADFMLFDTSGRTIFSTVPEDGKSELSVASGKHLRDLLTRLGHTDKNEVIGMEMGRWYAAAAVLNFPEMGIYGVRLIRFYDIDAAVPPVEENVDRRIEEFVLFIYMLMLAAISLVIVPLALFAHRIARPIAGAAAFADSLSSGGFPAPLGADKTGVTETAHLITALNRMRDRLNAMLTKLNRGHARELNARRDAESANALKADFIGAIAHDIGKILDAGMGFVSLMKQDRRSGVKEKEELVAAVSEQFHRLRLTESLLRRLSGLDVEQELKPVCVETFPLIRGELEKIESIRRDRHLELESQYASAMPKAICTDVEKIRTVLGLMLTAVLRCAPVGSRVSFVTETDTSNDRLKFRLEGEGANRAVLDYVLYRSGSQAAENLRAAAEVIQLTIALRAAHVIGGEFDVTCRDQSYAAVLSFSLGDLVPPDESLKRSADNSHQAENFDPPDPMRTPRRARASGHRSKDNTRVLSIALDESNSLLLGMMFRDLPCDVTENEDFNTAAASLESGAYDAVVFDPDSHAGDRSVPEMLRILKAAARRDLNGNPPRIVVLVSSSSAADEEKEFLAAGADECLMKPVSQDDLSSALGCFAEPETETFVKTPLA